jgi:hypothetical protein
VLSLILDILVLLGPTGGPAVLLPALIALGGGALDLAPREGDLIFVDMDCGPLCEAIEDVTIAQLGQGQPRWSHVGIFSWSPEGPVVLEARGPVRATPWSAFLAETLRPGAPTQASSRSLTGFCVLRTTLDLPTRRALVARALARLGAPYDGAFAWGDGAWYCSELVAHALAEVGAPAAWTEPLPMAYGSPEATPAAHATWRAYFAERGEPVPEARPGLSPLALWVRISRDGARSTCFGASMKAAELP